MAKSVLNNVKKNIDDVLIKKIKGIDGDPEYDPKMEQLKGELTEAYQKAGNDFEDLAKQLLKLAKFHFQSEKNSLYAKAKNIAKDVEDQANLIRKKKKAVENHAKETRETEMKLNAAETFMTITDESNNEPTINSENLNKVNNSHYITGEEKQEYASNQQKILASSKEANDINRKTELQTFLKKYGPNGKYPLEKNLPEGEEWDDTKKLQMQNLLIEAKALGIDENGNEITEMKLTGDVTRKFENGEVIDTSPDNLVTKTMHSDGSYTTVDKNTGTTTEVKTDGTKKVTTQTTTTYDAAGNVIG